ncbi:MAG: hypothetical protein WC878_03505 [Candidatus Paceibacterota bacterium]|jgi:hypothetical protein
MDKAQNKRDKFKQFAVKRTNNVLNQLRVLGNLSNRSAYEYTEEEVSKIFSEIDRAVKDAKSSFHFPKKNKEFKF